MTEAFSLFGSALYSMSEADWNDPSLNFPDAVTDPVVLNNYPIDEMGEVSRYSELEFSLAEISLGGSYAFSPALYATLELSYRSFKDDDPYVYGDQDGDAYQGYAAVGYKF